MNTHSLTPPGPIGGDTKPEELARNYALMHPPGARIERINAFLAGHFAASESARETIEYQEKTLEECVKEMWERKETIERLTRERDEAIENSVWDVSPAMYEAKLLENTRTITLMKIEAKAATASFVAIKQERDTLQSDLAKAREERDLARTAGHLLERVRDAAWAECQTLRAELSAAKAKIVCFADDGTTATTWEQLAEDRSQEMARLKVELSAANARAAKAERERGDEKLANTGWRVALEALQHVKDCFSAAEFEGGFSQDRDDAWKTEVLNRRLHHDLIAAVDAGLSLSPSTGLRDHDLKLAERAELTGGKEGK